MRGMATLTNTNVYTNQATNLHVCSPFQLSSIALMERYVLRFLACRAVASLSTPTQSLTLTAAVSITTPLLLCACILKHFAELSSIAPLEC